MSAWKDEADFMKDIENVSEFFLPGNHNNPATKFTFRSKKQNRIISTPWYEESDSDESTGYSLGRGRSTEDSNRNPGPELDHHEVMRDIRMQVRNTVGNRYSNEALESYYNVYQDEMYQIPENSTEVPENGQTAEEERSTPTNEKKCSVAEKIESTVANLSLNDQNSLSADSSPKREKRYGNHRGNHRKNGARNRKSNPVSPVNGVVDIDCKTDFPPLS